MRFQLIGYVAISLVGYWNLLLKQWSTLRASWKWWFVISWTVVFVNALRGIYNEAPFHIFAINLIPHMFVGSIVLPWSPWLRRAFVQALTLHLPLGIAAIYFFVVQRGELGRDFLTAETGRSISLLYAWPFLLLLWPELSFRQRIIAALGFLTHLAMAVGTRTRGMTLMCLLVLAYFLQPGTTRKPRGLTTNATFLALVLVLLGFAALWSDTDRWFTAYDQLMDRTTAIWDNDDYFEKEGRSAEAEYLFHELSLEELVLGRGFGASWQSPLLYEGAERYFVHIGYFHIVFEMGLVGLLLYALGPLYLTYRMLRVRLRDRWSFAVAGVLLARAVEMLHLGAPRPVPEFLLAMICAGYALSQLHRPPSQTHPQQVPDHTAGPKLPDPVRRLPNQRM